MLCGPIPRLSWRLDSGATGHRHFTPFVASARAATTEYQTGQLKQPTLISPSSGAWQTRDRGANKVGFRGPPLGYVLGRVRRKELLSLLIKALIPSRGGGHLPDLTTFQRPHLATIPWRLGLPHGFWRDPEMQSMTPSRWWQVERVWWSGPAPGLHAHVHADACAHTKTQRSRTYKHTAFGHTRTGATFFLTLLSVQSLRQTSGHVSKLI